MRAYRPRISTLLHILSTLLVIACGGGAGERAGAESAGANPTAGFKVALLTPGPISDQSWNGGAYRGLERIRDSIGAQISHIQTKTPAEFEENFRQYGAQGYALVFGHGFEFQDAAERVAPEFPRTVYVTTSGNRVGRNLAGIEFSFEEASYLAGMIAGAMTRSGTVGVIGGTELPPVQRSFVAFEAGARRARPGVRVITSYLGNWDDVGAGKEQALAQIGRGADVIFQNADAAGLGVFNAARESPGVYVFGSNSNQNGVAPAVTLGSVVIDLPHAFLTVAREVKGGGFKPRVIALGGKSSVVTLVLNPALESRIPAATRAAVDSARGAIEAGTFAVPTGGR
ncbi:MAG: ABC transporter, substrate-binding protein (cluster 11, riboflavin/purine nucleoside/unknown) [uncultured Gemmatimonadaceae bacterium]|uniref:ABC transporter substrate-binding protein PnrA-like domain-containing protein n=1 Tax=uncultured Gemmatimonadaceae bacterium TaxID=246130 RepID=A0A6J4KB32_9BACT|nr:MAG: ABC transporter, substrate-binding protein (cluster 11, riboflavin/purine nucleoside/unknown) [uncultured Gemmatimonadaceae bacterium]